MTSEEYKAQLKRLSQSDLESYFQDLGMYGTAAIMVKPDGSVAYTPMSDILKEKFIAEAEEKKSATEAEARAHASADRSRSASRRDDA